MGLFSFVKNAGAKLFGHKEEKPAATVSSAPAAPVTPVYTQEELDAAMAQRLKSELDDYGFSTDTLAVSVKGDIVSVAGTLPSQADKEKAILVLGNVSGVAFVDDQIAVDSPEPESQFHTVISGDTLGKISKHYYGDAGKYTVIFEANKPMLSHPDKIYVGQVLRIPALA